MENILKGFVVYVLMCGVFGDKVKTEVKTVSVYESDSVTLETDTDIQRDDKIYWRFEEAGSPNLVVQMLGNRILYTDYVDGRFKDRLQILDSKTGDLTIKNMRTKHTGLYEAEINTGTGSSYKKFRVVVKESPLVIGAGSSEVKSVSVMEGDSVTLYTHITKLQRDDLILWRFGDEGVLIAKGDMEDNKISYSNDGSFRDRLKLNDQTGDLIITDSKSKHSGVYQLKISSNKQTLYKTFSVTVTGGGWSSGVIAGLCVFFLLVIVAVIAVGVILYRRKKNIVTKEVPEGDTLALTGTYRELETGTRIEWKFNSRVIMTGKMTENEGIRVTNNDDQQFRDRLNLNPYFGHLIIKNISKEDSGLYEVKITNNKETTHNKIQVNVIVEIEVPEGDPIALPCDVRELQTGAQIEWTFNDRVIVTGEMTEKEGIRVIKGVDQQFKSRLNLNNNHQFLYISNISKEDTGLYEVKITNKKQTLHFIFQVKVAAGYMTPFEGENVHLPGADSVLQTGTQIVWKFKGRVIMTGEMTKDKGITEIYIDEQFKDRLELGDYIGHLIIKNILKEDSGVYEVNITYNKQTTHNKTKVEVIDASTGDDLNEQTGGMIVLTMFKGDPVALRGAESELQTGTLIEWTFKDRVITTGVKTEDKGIYLIRSVDQQFNGRLKFDNSVGYLFINDISEQDSGVYEVKITNNKGTSRNKTQVIVIAGSPKEDLNRQKGEPVKTVYGVVNVVEKDSARTYRNDSAVDIPLLEKV